MKPKRLDFSFITKEMLENELYENEKSIKKLAIEHRISLQHLSSFRDYIHSLGYKGVIKRIQQKRIGKRYNKLIIESLDKRNNKGGNRNVWYKCICDCGGEALIEGYRLKTTLSCGCEGTKNKRNKNNPCWRGYQEISQTYFSTIECNAKQRNLEFNITIEDVWELFLKQNRQCALTGIDLKFNSTGKSHDGNASLDRINSNIGYKIDNVQWVHVDINFMKHKYNEDYFIEMCRKVASYR